MIKPEYRGPYDFSRRFLPDDLNVRLLGRVALMSIAVSFVMALWQFLAGLPVNGLLLLSIAVTLAVSIIGFDHNTFNERKLNVLIGIVALLMLAVGLVSGRQTPAVTMLFPLLPFVAAALGAKRSAIIWVVVTFCMMFVIYLSGQSHAISFTEQYKDFTLLYICVAGILSIILSIVGFTLMGKRSLFLATLDNSKLELQQANAQANRASDAKSRFLGRMSHELRTPLNSIIGFTHLLVMDTKNPLPAIQLERLRHIGASGHRLLELVNDVLAVTRRANGDAYISLQPVLPVAVINEAVGAFKQLADGRSIRIIVDAPAHESTLLLADRQCLLDVFGQLLTNAIIHGQSGELIKISVLAGDESVSVEINTSGLGMTPGEISQLFEPFSQLPLPESTRHGSRLGISVAKSLIEQMAGKIAVKNLTAGSMTVTMILPRYRPNAG